MKVCEIKKMSLWSVLQYEMLVLRADATTCSHKKIKSLVACCPLVVSFRELLALVDATLVFFANERWTRRSVAHICTYQAAIGWLGFSYSVSHACLSVLIVPLPLILCFG
jgi:hypothetical protein